MIPKLNNKGSFLLEVLLSIVILSTSLTVIVQAMTSSLRGSKYSSRYITASFILENELTNLFEQTGKPAPMASKEIAYFDQNDNYTLEPSLKDISTLEGSNIQELKINLMWMSGNKKNNIPVDTYNFTYAE